MGHHSLVTPIDWKPLPYCVACVSMHSASHHSLVTPIDWKPFLKTNTAPDPGRHHSLVTPIDWKQVNPSCCIPPSIAGHHSLVTPIDWKLLFAHPESSRQGGSPLAGDTY